MIRDEKLALIAAVLKEAAGTANSATELCDRCGHPKGKHPYRHPFVAIFNADPVPRILALSPDDILARFEAVQEKERE